MSEVDTKQGSATTAQFQRPKISGEFSIRDVLLPIKAFGGGREKEGGQKRRAMERYSRGPQAEASCQPGCPSSRRPGGLGKGWEADDGVFYRGEGSVRKRLVRRISHVKVLHRKDPGQKRRRCVVTGASGCSPKAKERLRKGASLAPLGLVRDGKGTREMGCAMHQYRLGRSCWRAALWRGTWVSWGTTG